MNLIAPALIALFFIALSIVLFTDEDRIPAVDLLVVVMTLTSLINLYVAIK